MKPSPAHLLRALVLSATAAALTAAAVLLAAPLVWPVAGVRVEGARMVSETGVWEAIPDRSSLLTLNAGTLERKIETNPWVKGAEVSRDWESGIVVVQVEERRAVLDGLVDGRRIVVAADGAELPGVGGAVLGTVRLDRSEVEEVREAGRVFDAGGVELESVDAVDARGVRATVEGRTVTFAGEVGDGQVRALSGVMGQHPDAPGFDLRSPRRVVVEADADAEAGSDAGAVEGGG